MPYVHLNELSMYYEELGSGDAPSLILLHGAGGSADDPEGGWAALAPSFAEAFHVYSWNTAGTDGPGTRRDS